MDVMLWQCRRLSTAKLLPEAYQSHPFISPNPSLPWRWRNGDQLWT